MPLISNIKDKEISRKLRAEYYSNQYSDIKERNDPLKEWVNKIEKEVSKELEEGKK